MRTGISTLSLQTVNETEQAVEEIAKLGADCVEVNLRTFYEYRPEFSKSINFKNIFVSSVSANSDHFEKSLFSASRRVRGDGLYWLDQIVRSFAYSDCKTYCLHGTKTNLDEAAEYLRIICELCARYGTTLCVENSADGVYSKAGDFSDLKSRGVPIYGILNYDAARAEFADYLKDMQGSIVAVRLSDRDKEGKICLPGKGVTDFRKVIKKLKSVGFDGDLIIDGSLISPTLTELKDSLQYLNKLI